MTMLKWSAFALLLLGFAQAGVAQDFPNRPVHLVVPWPPSGNVDITARTIAPALSEALGQPVIVENRSGAGGTIGTGAVVKAAPDGYTLLVGSSGPIVASPAVIKNLPYDTMKDLVPVGSIQSAPLVLTAALKTPAASVDEFIALARDKPGEVSIASAGNGSMNHLGIELLMRQANLKLLHVPYKGGGPAINDLLGGQVQSMIDQLTSSMAHIRSGRIKALAVASGTRSPQMPNVPTFAEAGIKDAEAVTFTGLFAPAGTPPAVIATLSAALRKTVANATVRERFEAIGVDVMDMTHAEFASHVRAEYDKWSRIAREANIVVQ